MLLTFIAIFVLNVVDRFSFCGT